MIKTAWLITNYSCNNCCNYCYATLINEKGGFMSLSYAKDVLKELARIGVNDCLLIGGEPTLYSWLPEVIIYGNKLGLQMKIVTNGRLLNDKKFLQEIIACGIKHISISIEASNERAHNAICGTDAFNETITGIANCASVGISMNSVTTISKSNERDVTNVARLMHGLGVKNILFNYGVPTVFTEGVDNGEIFMSPRELAVAAIRAYRYLKKEKIKVRFFGTIPICAYGDKIQEMSKDEYISGGSSCHMFRGTGIAFEPSGKIIPCTHFVNTALFNAMDERGKFSLFGKLDVVWEDEVEIRKRFERALWKYPSHECQQCKLWGKCLGGCPLLWRIFNPKDYTQRY